MIGKSVAHVAMACIAVFLGLVAYWASDRSAPSYYIASWVMTRDLYPGGPIAARFILVRHRRCIKRIEHQIEQGNGRYPLRAEVMEMTELGLDEINLERPIPNEVLPGEAKYVVTFIWRCNLLQQFRPVTMTLEHPIIIEGPEQ